MTTLRIERVYPHPRALVWRALTERDLLERWLMPNDFEAVVGHRFTFRTEAGPGFDGIVRCEVLEIVVEQRLRISWVGGPIDTEVCFGLSDAPAGTRLSVEQTGFQGLRAWIVSRILAIGSRTLYGKRLPKVLDQLAQGIEVNIESEPNCMVPEQSLWERLLQILQRQRQDK